MFTEILTEDFVLKKITVTMGYGNSVWTSHPGILKWKFSVHMLFSEEKWRQDRSKESWTPHSATGESVTFKEEQTRSTPEIHLPKIARFVLTETGSWVWCGWNVSFQILLPTHLDAVFHWRNIKSIFIQRRGVSLPLSQDSDLTRSIATLVICPHMML